MGSSTSSFFNAASTGCGAGRDIVERDDCSQASCAKHALEHRQTFMNGFDKMIFDKNFLQQTFFEHIDQYHSLMDEIDRWEQESKDRIQQSAEDVRQRVKIFMFERERIVSSELHGLTENLRNDRQQDDFAQSDFHTWTNRMEELKRDLSSASASFCIREDPTQTLVANICLSPSTSQFVHNDSLVAVSDNYHIINSGRSVIRTDLWGNVSIRSKGEYSLGVHKFRFIIGTKNSLFSAQFGIISKFKPRVQAFSVFSGWEVNDCLEDVDGWQRVMHSGRNMDKEITLEVELTIDCHNQMIRFVNERTKDTREKCIDTMECPFPWHLCFYLDKNGDRVQLLSSS